MSSNVNNSAKDKYQWISEEERYPGAPPYVIGLPKGEGFSPWKIIIFDFTAIKTFLGLLFAQILHIISYFWKNKPQLKGVADLGLLSILAETNKWEKPEDLWSFFRFPACLPKPIVADKWDQDIEFGRQRLGGLNPVLIKKCHPEDLSIEGKFPVTNELLKADLGDNFSLESAWEKHQLYLLDYKLFDGIITEELEDQLGRYSNAPLCLLYLNDQDQLLPIAIKVTQEIGAPIFTPKSPQWSAAKLAVSTADIAYQGIIAHLLDTHLVAEIFAVSSYRTLSPDHILYQLLKPHFFNTLAINFMARSVFLGRGGFFDATGALGYTSSNELLNRGYRGEGIHIEYQGEPWEFYKKAFPYQLESRDVSQLPNYHYRDDATLLWEATKTYVTNVLTNHYQDVNSLVNDSQLQAWKNELISPQGGSLKGLLSPDKQEQLDGQLNNLDDLIDIVTNMIFTATSQHAAVNFGQYDYGAWVPNMPFALYQPFKSILEDVTKLEEKVLQWLPDRQQTIKQIVLVKILTILPPYTSKSLLTLGNPFKTDPSKQAFKDFKQRLKEIEKQLQERNKKLEEAGQIPYVYLLPSHIPQSIAI
ncbi:lipoxygenase family protein [Aphanothece sacrum]|uniref:AraC family transcriptional regulator n=1 Tax=Aphanothece sacrum FPU1 TaxID=1920663 RepID=A0A401IGP7_APHSA|nr:lipoxygenase family protein [Aphanothece sacrum]GBF80394.1 AraC family transcriptional regulator [Aphanothece sacrum FPU1]GBF84899.1 AraC family transcriptional regulator [Aphanothece sacrum FPU3]